jgi:plasmid stability protein
MSDILIRDVAPTTLTRLKHRAKRHHRSLQAEAKLLLEQAAGSEDVQGLLDAWQQRFAGRKFASSAELIREDRDR